MVKAVLERGKNTNTAVPQPFKTTIMTKNVQLAGVPEISYEVWQKEQSNDNDIGPGVELLKQKWHLQYVCKEKYLSGMRVILKYKQDLELKKWSLVQEGTVATS